jgi:quercetin dioxygenase-like cupin family protein
LAAASRIAVSGSSGGLDVRRDIRQAYLTMIIRFEDAPIFNQGGTTATGYASPIRGAHSLSVWRIALAPGESSPPHTLSHEEVFLVLEGSATATIAAADETIGTGDCLIVPPGTPFTLHAGRDGFGAVCAMVAGAQATIVPDGPTLTPPWAS